MRSAPKQFRDSQSIPLVDAKTIAQIRQELGSELATLVVSVATLQQQARKKFGPGVWWVTERSLQQATPWQVARLKASWLGDRTTYDLCCGVGGDAVQLAKRGRVLAVDWDATLAEMASANLVLSGAVPERAQATCGDATMIEIPSQAAVHIDPDRRLAGVEAASPITLCRLGLTCCGSSPRPNMSWSSWLRRQRSMSRTSRDRIDVGYLWADRFANNRSCAARQLNLSGLQPDARVRCFACQRRLCMLVPARR